MLTKRVKLVTTKTIHESEELKALNSRIQENRDRHAAKQMLDNYRRLFAAVYQHMREDAAAAQAKKHHLRKKKRSYLRQMHALVNRIILCVAVFIGVCLSWWFTLVSLEFLLAVFFICSCVVTFACGAGLEKKKQFGGGKR